jgi:hypothetical protein
MTYDISGKIGPLFLNDKKPDWPMYSYERPGWMLWNAIAGRLHEKGWSDDEIRVWLQSKEPRWALDGELGDAIKAIGEKFAETLNKDSLT